MRNGSESIVPHLAIHAEDRLLSLERGDGSPVYEAGSILVINEPEQLRALVGRKMLHSKQLLAIRLPNLSESDGSMISERLNRYRSECGCSLGAKSMAVGFVATMICLVLRYGFFTAALVWRLPLAFLGGLLLAGIGKAIGIAIARRGFRREIRVLCAATLNQNDKT